MKLLEAKGAKIEAHELNAALDLLFDLVRAAEDVGVVLREAAHAKEPMEHARALVPVDRPELSQPDRQFPVTLQRVLVYLNVKRAIHRLHVVVLAVDVHRRVHVFAVEVQVAAGLPQCRLADVG